MSKNIVFCGDGTWDSAENNTNVYKIRKVGISAVVLRDHLIRKSK